MLICSQCGAGNREGARFCDSCGAALAEAAAPREVRKVVTVLFCDVTGSTALGDVLLGEATFRLVRDAVEAEDVAPVAAKGKAEPLAAHRLLSVRAGETHRRDDAPMVGRQRQLQLLEHAFAAAAAERSCHLVTILGSAGVGKSRLTEEFLSALEGAAIVRGRCLSYGEGISYWPVTEVVKQLEPDASESAPLAAILGDEAAASS